MTWRTIRSATTNPLGFITTSVFDKLLRPVASVDPLLNRTTTTFDVGQSAHPRPGRQREHHDHDL